MPELTLTM